MIVATSQRIAGLAPRARLLVLTLFALFTAHDAVYVAQFGFGSGYASAMAATGHGTWYVPVSLLVGIAAAFVAGMAMLRLARLRRAAAAAEDGAARFAVTAVGAGYLVELRSLWLRLFPTVVALFALQENLESMAAGHGLPGADVLFGQGAGFVLPILGVTTFLLAVLGAAVRWRTRILLRRAAAARAFARPVAIRIPARWTTVCATLPHLWTLDRRDAGRAPPIAA